MAMGQNSPEGPQLEVISSINYGTQWLDQGAQDPRGHQIPYTKKAHNSNKWDEATPAFKEKH